MVERAEDLVAGLRAVAHHVVVVVEGSAVVAVEGLALPVEHRVVVVVVSDVVAVQVDSGDVDEVSITRTLLVFLRIVD